MLHLYTKLLMYYETGLVGGGGEGGGVIDATFIHQTPYVL